MIVLLRGYFRYLYLHLLCALFLVIALSACSCGDDRRTRALTEQQDSTMAVLFTLTGDIAHESTIIDSLKAIKEDLKKQDKVVNDSAFEVERENPIAATYIHTFDRYPIDILEQVLTELKEDNSVSLFTRGFLIIYGNDSSAHINDVRSQFNRLDEATKKIANKTEVLNGEIERHQKTIFNKTDEIANLRMLHEDLTRELKDLKN
jgi:hypothetical protein